jgi:hypothetical protein
VTSDWSTNYIKRDHKKDAQIARTLSIHEEKDKNVQNFGGET